MIGRLLTLTLALGASACASAPPVRPVEIQATFPERWSAATPAAGTPAPQWWQDFGDEALSDAVATALEQNYDLLASAARLEQAAAAAKIAGADLQPQVSAGFNAARRRQNFIGFPIPGGERRVLSSFSTSLGVSFDTSWEVDLWGRLRAGSRAALAELQRSAADLRGARLSLTGQTAKAWFAIREAALQRDLARETVRSFRESAEQVQTRFELGIRPALDLRLARTSLANAEALLSQRLLQHDNVTRQLELLMGEYASRQIAGPQDLPQTPGPVPAGLPADLVSRRPDLVAAERRLAAEAERLSIARADLYPRISLTAGAGTSSSALANLIDGDFSVWSLVGGIVQPLFQGGRLRAAVDQSEARANEALALYAGTALLAYAEVESALAAERFLQERERHLVDQVEQALAAQRLALERYRTGLNDYISVLESQRSALAAQTELIAARRARLDNRVDLHLALGGGFETEPSAPTSDGVPQSALLTPTERER